MILNISHWKRKQTKVFGKLQYIMYSRLIHRWMQFPMYSLGSSPPWWLKMSLKLRYRCPSWSSPGYFAYNCPLRTMCWGNDIQYISSRFLRPRESLKDTLALSLRSNREGSCDHVWAHLDLFKNQKLFASQRLSWPQFIDFFFKHRNINFSSYFQSF